MSHNENHELIKNAVKYIDKLGSGKTTIEEVAKNAGFSIDYFNRIFRNHTGFNVMEYSRFRRLNKAARLLRLSDTDILTIALECGYDSHEGFIRAFKDQYGKTPSEYRESMKGKQFVWADHELNATAVAEFRHTLPDFSEINADDAIDWLLEKDAKRYGYTAVTIAFNGSKVLSNSSLQDKGCFVTSDNFYDQPLLTLVLNNIEMLREYVETLMQLSPGNIDCIFDTDVSLEDVEKALEGIPYRTLKANPETMYFGDPFVLPEEAKEYDIHVLEFKDMDAVDAFISAHPDPIVKRTVGYGIRNILQQPLAQRPLEQNMGVFKDGKLLAIAYDGLQSAHGFCLNNCIHTPFVPGAPQDAIKYLYLAATNAVMERGYIPFEDAQFDEYANVHGGFDAYELGFERVNTVFSIEF